MMKTIILNMVDMQYDNFLYNKPQLFKIYIFVSAFSISDATPRPPKQVYSGRGRPRGGIRPTRGTEATTRSDIMARARTAGNPWSSISINEEVENTNPWQAVSASGECEADVMNQVMVNDENFPHLGR